MQRLGGVLVMLAAASLSGCGSDTLRSDGGDSGGVRLLVFASDRAGVPGQFDIYLYDMNEFGFRVLAGANSPTASDSSPSITSDARFVAFESDRGGAGGSDILLFDRAIPGLIALPGVNSPSDESQPAFTHDAFKLIFVRDTLGYKRIRLLDGVPDRYVPLPRLDSTATFNDWSPAPDQTGNRIAFVSDRDGTADVFVWDRTIGLMDVPELRSAGRDIEPWLTPDGRYVAFASDRMGGHGGFDVYLYDLSADSLVTLGTIAHPLNSGADDRNPALSRDGNIITFQSNRAAAAKFDLFNHSRPDTVTGQSTGIGSMFDDVQPSLRWP